MTFKRRDKNHTEIIKVLRKFGALVFDTADIGKGFPDVVCSISDVLYFIEIKDGSKPPSQQKLTPSEAEFHRQWAHHVVIINSIDSAIQFVNMVRVNASFKMP